MIKQLAYQILFDYPIVFWLGIAAISSVSFTALIAFLNKKGIHKIPLSLHPKIAVIALILAFIHGLLALSLYLNF
ncbi:MAG: hypothetical protein AB1498_09825 [bacterium]